MSKMDKKYCFSDVNLTSIEFINNRNDIRFEFFDSYYDRCRYCGELLCLNVFSLTMRTDLGSDPEFAQFVCDVSVEEESNKQVIKFLGSAYEIAITCERVSIIKS